MKDTISAKSVTVEELPIAPRAVSNSVNQEAGGWLWFSQRFSAVALLPLLGLHIWVGHFLNLEPVKAGSLPELVFFSDVAARLQTFAFIFIDFALLAAALWHGLNGARTVITDFGVTGAAETVVSAILWILGIAAFIYGANTLLIFIVGSGFF